MAMGLDASPLLTQDSVCRRPSRHSTDEIVIGAPPCVAGPSHVCSFRLGACVSNLVLAVLGAGQLVLPYALSQLGLGFGIAALLLFALLSIHSCYTLSIYELHFMPQPLDCIESYAELVVRALGNFGKHVCTVLLVLYAWGGALSFMVILKGELEWLTGMSGGVCLVVVAALFILPLSSREDLSALKTTSPLGCIAGLFITAVVLMSTRWNGEAPLGAEVCQGPRGGDHQDAGESLRWWPDSLASVAAALPLLSFALNSTWAYIPILCTLKDRTPTRYSGLICSSTGIMVVNYWLISVYGYAMFCGATKPNILDSLGSEATPGTGVAQLVYCARVALATQLSLALPMRFFIARRSFDCGVTSLAGRLSLSAGLVGSATGLAILPLSLATVLGLVSSVCASMIIYILPALVDLSLQLPDPLLPGRMRQAVSMVSLSVGAFVLVGGLAANLLGISVGGG
mmetsp:Transcript_68357/g.222310  ORF Transcript_68357/g.222310 Transcript_68357/m.222310 type:complete len:457 (+) Transcript_68357:91-1461(+)|eukprot:CAMPEP_0203920860 /NCGR_PEP_ID=MMETSP0359-20131031/61096_1 /ASSEMBLY_ACC=CAM_ASM_000338 /TAXON_ID=268821 /ORGANISM="Scrippsiella Hangoei, Strain SHTV-5" /LENGTH=456 /DNA_ID=CAMNT_0050848439 /DNA_START=79 /DNA_END=1449 /DNA_ORIENTATION=-